MTRLGLIVGAVFVLLSAVDAGNFEDNADPRLVVLSRHDYDAAGPAAATDLGRSFVS